MATSSKTKALGSFICQSCRQSARPPPQPVRRLFSTSSAIRSTQGFYTSPPQNRQGSFADSNDSIHNILGGIGSGDHWDLGTALNGPPGGIRPTREPHRLHVYATKHNTHITLVQPAKLASQTTSSSVSETSARAEDRKKTIDVLLSLSTGNIGFKKAGRGTYDAAYQLAAFVMKQIQEKGMLADIQDLHVILRGFGAGREAVTKALLGTEGRLLRGSIKAVADATRLKHGGTRSKKPRRLG